MLQIINYSVFTAADSADTGKRYEESLGDMDDTSNAFDYFGTLASHEAGRVVIQQRLEAEADAEKRDLAEHVIDELHHTAGHHLPVPRPRPPARYHEVSNIDEGTPHGTRRYSL